MLHRRIATIAAVAAAVVATAPAGADSAADKAAIMQRLQRWTAAFNAKDTAGGCDLFAPDLIYAVPQVEQGSRKTLCSNLDKVLAKPEPQLHYDNPDVHEIIVAGDLAIVRFVSFTTRPNKLSH